MSPAASPGGLRTATPAAPLSGSWGLLPARTCRPAPAVLPQTSWTTPHCSPLRSADLGCPTGCMAVQEHDCDA